MAKRLNIGIDIDGVLAGFVPAARKVCQKLFDGRPDDKLVQTSWAFDSLGMTQEEERQMYGVIDSTPNWWLGLPILPNTDLLPQLCEKHRVIFITNRKDGLGWAIEDQSKVWLKRNFGITHTNVVISDCKGPVAKGLKLNAFIDDRPKNVYDVVLYSPETEAFLLDTTYNQDDGVNVFVRAFSFNDFAKEILEAQ